MDLSELRISYTKAGLVETDADPDPVSQFRIWMDQAIAIGLLEPNAMTLATTDASGQPDVRIVLLKAFDESGFVFYTNYESRKAREIDQNAHVSLLFYWGELERQVRIAGVAVRVSEAESDEYFQSRPVETPTRSVGVEPEYGYRVPSGTRGPSSEPVQAIRVCPNSSSSTLGRLPSSASGNRVLAGAAQSTARSPGVSPVGRCLGYSTAFTLSPERRARARCRQPSLIEALIP